jgi:hypothetical protein
MPHTFVALITIVTVFGTPNPGWADEFTSAVEQVLMLQKEITDLPPVKQREMISCVNGVLASVPDPTKAEVAQAANIDEMEDRFGDMVMADQAKLKQEITAQCGSIVMEGSG